MIPLAVSASISYGDEPLALRHVRIRSGARYFGRDLDVSTLIVLALIGAIVSAVATVVAAGMMLRDARARRDHLSKKDAAPSGWLPLMLTCLALTMLFGFAEQLLIGLQRGSFDVLGATALAVTGAAAIIAGFVAVIVTVTWRAREKRADIPQ